MHVIHPFVLFSPDLPPSSRWSLTSSTLTSRQRWEWQYSE